MGSNVVSRPVKGRGTDASLQAPLRRRTTFALINYRRQVRRSDSFIRAIGFAGTRLGIEFCPELRLETAASLYELSFSPRSVKQHGAESFRPQHEESKHKREYDFRPESHEFTPRLSLCR